ncbi:metallophosphoesterase family protein [Planctomycetota bacterium]
MQLFGRKSVVITVVLCALMFASTSCTSGARDNKPGPAYSFVYLGDMHFDKMAHHDFEWVKAEKPNDIRQIEGYVKNTEEYTPSLLRRVQTSIESSDGRIKMVVQGGDLTEGLCGSRELQETQFKDTREIIRKYIPETKFVAGKGNHDITGPGAREAYDNVMLPWLSEECEKKIDSASFFFMQGPDLFVFFDAYHNNKLDWLEKTLSENKHRHAIVVMHPPAVPYNARSTWHLFSREREKDVRERFLNILGKYKVVLLTAHLHKYHVLVRKTPAGAFTQFSMSSVLGSPDVSVRNHREGIENYGAPIVEFEPEFQPDSKQLRQKMLDDEKPYIEHFEFANFPGYAVINVSDAGINADIYTGDSGRIWKSTPLSSVPEN